MKLTANRARALGLFGLALVLFTWGLGLESFYDWDEAWYAQIAREILRSGDWVTLHWLGVPFFDKPPLAIWAITASVGWLGASEFAARLPSALSAVATIAATGWIATMVHARRRAAWLSALVLLTTLPYVKAARMAMLDGPLTLAFTLGVGCYLAAQRDRRWGLGLGLALALTWMIKGPVALLLMLVLIGSSIWQRDARPWRSVWFAAGALLGLGLVAPWYVLEVQRHGAGFLQSHFGTHILRRAAAGLDGHQGPLTFYLTQLASLDHPWFLALFPAGLWAWTRRRAPGMPVLLAWAVGVVGAFSVAATKLPWYVMPCYPALALVLGGYLDAIMAREVPARRLGWGWLGLGLGLGAAMTIYLVSFGHPGDRAYLPATWLLAGGMAGAGGMLLSKRPERGPVLVLVMSYLAMLSLIPAGMHWEGHGAPDLKAFSAIAAQRLASIPVLLTLELPRRPSLYYYLDRPERPTDPEALLKGWGQGQAALMPEGTWAALSPRLAGATAIARADGLVLISSDKASRSAVPMPIVR